MVERRRMKLARLLEEAELSAELAGVLRPFGCGRLSDLPAAERERATALIARLDALAGLRRREEAN